jgi:hypothetical protein
MKARQAAPDLHEGFRAARQTTVGTREVEARKRCLSIDGAEAKGSIVPRHICPSNAPTTVETAIERHLAAA